LISFYVVYFRKKDGYSLACVQGNIIGEENETQCQCL